MNSNFVFIATVILGLITVTCFFYLVFLKIKLFATRKRLQEQGVIEKAFNLYLTSFFELVFWMLPVFIKYTCTNIDHKRQMNRINVLWLIMLGSAVLTLKIG